MRKIFAIAWKDTLISFSQASQWIFFIVLPVMFTLILSGGLGGNNSNGDNRIKLAVVNEANSPAARQLLDVLGRSTSLQAHVLPSAQAEADFKANKTSAVLTIPASFDEEALQAGSARLQLMEQLNSLNAPIIERGVDNAIQTLGAAYDAARSAVAEAARVQPFADTATQQAYFTESLISAQALSANAPARMTLTRPATTTASNSSAVLASAGQLITWVFIPMLGIAAQFAFERQNGTMRRLLTTPATHAQLLLGTITGQVLTALVQMGLLVGFGIVVMKLPWGQNPIALAVLLVAFACAGVALGTMLGTFAKSEAQASGLSTLLGMVMALLGGCWYPMEIFPEMVRTVVHVLPTTWAMDGMRDLIGRGLGLQAILPNVAVLIGFAVVFFGIGVARFRYD